MAVGVRICSGVPAATTFPPPPPPSSLKPIIHQGVGAIALHPGHAARSQGIDLRTPVWCIWPSTKRSRRYSPWIAGTSRFIAWATNVLSTFCRKSECFSAGYVAYCDGVSASRPPGSKPSCRVQDSPALSERASSSALFKASNASASARSFVLPVVLLLRIRSSSEGI